jgi:hypothetical protein
MRHLRGRHSILDLANAQGKMSTLLLVGLDVGPREHATPGGDLRTRNRELEVEVRDERVKHDLSPDSPVNIHVSARMDKVDETYS